MSEHGVHAGGHGGDSCGFSHPDQSANWNMAMQTGDASKLDAKHLLKSTDPRFVIGGALVLFMVLISLPYVLDAIEDEQVNKSKPSGAGEPALEAQAGAPPAAMPMSAEPQGSAGIPGALTGSPGHQLLSSQQASSVQQALNASGLLFGSGAGSGKLASNDDSDMQYDAAMSSHAEEEEGSHGSGREGGSGGADAFFQAVDEAQLSHGRSGRSARHGGEDYTKDAVQMMVAASGLSPNAVQSANPAAGAMTGATMGGEAPVQHVRTVSGHATIPGAMAPVVAAPMPEYGGAVQSATQPYMIYVPDQYGATISSRKQAAPVVLQRYAPESRTLIAAAPGPAGPAPNTVAMAPTGAAPIYHAPTVMGVPVAGPIPAGAQPQMAAAAPVPAPANHLPLYDPRASFNPNTSAIVSPIGMRHHAAPGPMQAVPTGGGEYGIGPSGRVRMFVNR